MAIEQDSATRGSETELEEDEVRLRLVKRQVRKRWFDACVFVGGFGIMTVVVVTAVSTFPGVTEGHDHSNPLGVFWSYWQEQMGFRSTLRDNLSGIALGLLAIAALPAVASRASKAESVHAHVDSHVGWQIANLASALLGVLSWLSLPMSAEEVKGLDQWVGIAGLSLAVVILLATGPRYLHIHAGEKSTKRRIDRLENCRTEALDDAQKVTAWWRKDALLIYLSGLVVLILLWYVVTGLDSDSRWLNLLGLVAVTMAAVWALELVLRLRYLLDPILRGSRQAALVRGVQVVLGVYLAALLLAGLGAASVSPVGIYLAVITALWTVGALILFMVKPPAQVLAGRVRYLENSITKGETQLADLQQLRAAE